jgi:hypothetical protein
MKKDEYIIKKPSFPHSVVLIYLNINRFKVLIYQGFQVFLSQKNNDPLFSGIIESTTTTKYRKGVSLFELNYIIFSYI